MKDEAPRWGLRASGSDSGFKSSFRGFPGMSSLQSFAVRSWKRHDV